MNLIMLYVCSCSLYCHCLTHSPLSDWAVSHFSHDSFPMCPLQLNPGVPHLRPTGQGRRVSAETISHAWTLLCGSVDVIKTKARHCKQLLLCTHAHTHTNTHKQSIISEIAQHSLSSVYCFPFSLFHITSCSRLSPRHSLFPSPLPFSLQSLIVALAH